MMKYSYLTKKALRALMLCWAACFGSVQMVCADTVSTAAINEAKLSIATAKRNEVKPNTSTEVMNAAKPNISTAERNEVKPNASTEVMNEAKLSVIEEAHQEIDAMVDRFQKVFKNSFSETSTEKFNVTAQKMGECREAIEELIVWLEQKCAELEADGKEYTNDYKYINQFIRLCNEFFKKQIIPIHQTLATNLKCKKKLGVILNGLKQVVDPIMTKANFDRIKEYLDSLCAIAAEEGLTSITDTLESIWTEALDVRKEYDQGIKNLGAFIMKNRKRMPYR